MKRRVMWVENKSQGDGLSGPAHIGWVEFSKSGKSIRYRDGLFLSLKGAGFKANYFDEKSGDHYWISGCKVAGGDALYSTEVLLDEDAVEEYWLHIRNLPEEIDVRAFMMAGKY